MNGYVFTNIPAFNSLTYPQRLATLHRVTQALFRPEIPMPELTALLESTVVAVLQNVRWLLKEEIEDMPDDTSFRSLVGQACRDLSSDGGLDLPADSCDDMREWGFCVDRLHNGILWDTDYLAEASYVDHSPARGKTLKERMGVSQDYFLAIAPEPTPPQMEILRDELEMLCLEISEALTPQPLTAPQELSGESAEKKASGEEGKAEKKPSTE